MKLRGLNGLCPDVRKWSPPPGPAAFLDSGLPKPVGVGSLPLGLSAANPSLSPGRRGGNRECGGGKDKGNEDKRIVGRSSTAIDVSGTGKSTDGNEGNGSSIVNGDSKKGGGKEGGYSFGRRGSSSSFQPVPRRKSSVDSCVSTNSIPAPTWKVEGPEGVVSQVNPIRIVHVLPIYPVSFQARDQYIGA